MSLLDAFRPGEDKDAVNNADFIAFVCDEANTEIMIAAAPMG